MKDQPVIRDERSTAVENASYRVAYMVMSYGALAIVDLSRFCSAAKQLGSAGPGGAGRGSRDHLPGLQ